MAKKDTLPMNIDLTDLEPGSNIVYSNEVVSIIAGVAASEVEGIASMVNVPSSNLLGKNRGVTTGVKVETGTEEASVDLYVNVEYGTPIQTCAAAVQENVRKSIESMTGLHVVRVDVHVQGVSFEKEQAQPALEGFESLTGIAAKNEPVKAEKPVEPVKPVKVEFEGEPTPAEEHEPTAADIELEQAKAEAEEAAAEETVTEE